MNAPAPVLFPVVRWVALAWLAGWFSVYWVWWGPKNFLYFCDIAVILTCLGLWRGGALLLSSQAVGAIFVNLVWCLDVSWRAASGAHLLGGTEFMFDAQHPLWLRLMSLYHFVWPPLLVWALRRTGYHPRGLWLQIALAVPVMAASRLLAPGLNINFAYRDPLFAAQWGPGAVHVAAMTVGLIVLIYLPTHWALKRFLPPARRP